MGREQCWRGERFRRDIAGGREAASVGCFDTRNWMLDTGDLVIQRALERGNGVN